ncbi:hypothetical protein CRYUN_Cryun08bG0037100 [Craigia yunnanensis]
MPDRDIVSWSGMIDGCTKMNRYTEALGLFRRMVADDGVEPCEITVLAIWPAVLNIGDVRICQLIHGYGEKRGFHVFDIRVLNSLLDTYAKRGIIEDALNFSFKMEPENAVSIDSPEGSQLLHLRRCSSSCKQIVQVSVKIWN